MSRALRLAETRPRLRGANRRRLINLMALSDLILTCHKGAYMIEATLFPQMIGPIAPRRILLTGAGGFVGGWVLRGLETRGTSDLEIFASGHKSEIPSPAAKNVRFDITDRAQVDEIIRGVRPNAVIHLAAVSACARRAKPLGKRGMSIFTAR